MKLTRVITYEGSEAWIESILKEHCSLEAGYTWKVSASISDGGGGEISEVFRSLEGRDQRVTKTFDGLSDDTLLQWAEDEDHKEVAKAQALRDIFEKTDKELDAIRDSTRAERVAIEDATFDPANDCEWCGQTPKEEEWHSPEGCDVKMITKKEAKEAIVSVLDGDPITKHEHCQCCGNGGCCKCEKP